jgi:hypothetical protein
MEGATMDDETDRAPWTIKAVRVSTRQSAVRAAVKRGETMGEWITRAVENQIARENGEVVLPPDHREQTKARAPSVSAELAGMLHAIAAVMTLPNIAPGAVKDGSATVRSLLRMVRGLPPVRPRSYGRDLILADGLPQLVRSQTAEQT